MNIEDLGRLNNTLCSLFFTLKFSLNVTDDSLMVGRKKILLQSVKKIFSFMVFVEGIYFKHKFSKETIHFFSIFLVHGQLNLNIMNIKTSAK